MHIQTQAQAATIAALRRRFEQRPLQKRTAAGKRRPPARSPRLLCAAAAARGLRPPARVASARQQLRAASGRSAFNNSEFFRQLVQRLHARFRHGHEILHAHAEAAREVNARLHREGHARLDTGMESEEAAAAAQERMNARRDAIQSQPDAEPLENEDDYPAGSFGYVYRAYPTFAKFFYREKQPGEGEIYLGYESQARLLYQWNDDGSVRLYLENPEVADSGEILVP